MASKLKAATRMELLRLKKKITLASKGHKLLKEKRDALISEFFKLIDKLRDTRKELEIKLQEAFRSIITAQAVSGVEEVKRAAQSSAELPEIEMKLNTIMGVKTPTFKLDNVKVEHGYSLIGTSIEIDNAAKGFEEALELLIKLAEVEATVKRLADEIKKTKRKVNALERILIPRLEQDVVYIKMRLEEMERESFTRLKLIKEII